MTAQAQSTHPDTHRHRPARTAGILRAAASVTAVTREDWCLLAAQTPLPAGKAAQGAGRRARR